MHLDHRFSVHQLDVEDIKPKSPRQRLVKKLLLVLASASLFALSAHYVTQWLLRYAAKPANVTAVSQRPSLPIVESAQARTSVSSSAEPTETVDNGEVPTSIGSQNEQPTTRTPSNAQRVAQAPARPANKSNVNVARPPVEETRVATPRAATPPEATVHTPQPSVALINAIVEHHASGQSPHKLSDLIKRCTGTDPIEKALCLKTVCKSAMANKTSAAVCSP